MAAIVYLRRVNETESRLSEMQSIIVIGIRFSTHVSCSVLVSGDGNCIGLLALVGRYSTLTHEPTHQGLHIFTIATKTVYRRFETVTGTTLE